MGSLLGTAFSDAVTSIAAYRTTHKWYNRDVSMIPIFAFLMMSIASAVAAINHSQDTKKKKTSIAVAYQCCIWLTWTVAIPLFAVYFCCFHGSVLFGVLLAIYSVVILISSVHMSQRQREMTGTMSASLSFLLIFIVSLANTNWNGLVGSGLYLLSGWVVGMEGELREIGVYNDIVTLANIFFASCL